MRNPGEGSPAYLGSRLMGSGPVLDTEVKSEFPRPGGKNRGTKRI
jgi:hypothetical protein